MAVYGPGILIEHYKPTHCVKGTRFKRISTPHILHKTNIQHEHLDFYKKEEVDKLLNEIKLNNNQYYTKDDIHEILNNYIETLAKVDALQNLMIDDKISKILQDLALIDEAQDLSIDEKILEIMKELIQMYNK